MLWQKMNDFEITFVIIVYILKPENSIFLVLILLHSREKTMYYNLYV